MGSRQRLEPWEIDRLAAAAQIYVDAFTDDDRLTSLREIELLQGYLYSRFHLC